MSDNETMNVSCTAGHKAGNDERYDLLPPMALRRWAVVHGTFRPGQRGSFNELNDHLWSFWEGNEHHPVNARANLPAAAWHASKILAEYLEAKIAYDMIDEPTVYGDDLLHREQFRLLEDEPLRLLARHYGVGARKYEDDNWRKGYDWRLSFAALNRHLWQWWAGEEIDQETGSYHLVAVIWHALTLDEFTRIASQFDTRTSTKIRQWLHAERDIQDISGVTSPVGTINLDQVINIEVQTDKLDANCSGYRWRSRRGDVYECRDGVWGIVFKNGVFGWIGKSAGAFPPYTRLERIARRINTLGEAERNAEWFDNDGDRHRYSHERGCWEWRRELDEIWRRFNDEHANYGPYIEAINQDTESTAGQSSVK
jgi:hypothetical protein